jgi:hypothetical protein
MFFDEFQSLALFDSNRGYASNGSWVNIDYGPLTFCQIFFFNHALLLFLSIQKKNCLKTAHLYAVLIDSPRSFLTNSRLKKHGK